MRRLPRQPELILTQLIVLLVRILLTTAVKADDVNAQKSVQKACKVLVCINAILRCKLYFHFDCYYVIFAYILFFHLKAS